MPLGAEKQTDANGHLRTGGLVAKKIALLVGWHFEREFVGEFGKF